jgi:outer membrane immunogenic protein
MKKLVLGSMALVAFAAAPALAADMNAVPAPIDTKAPLYSWTGCYVGANLGGGWSKQDQARIDQIGVGPAAANYGSESDSAFIGGFQIGCDYQFAGNWVVGAQGQVDGGNMSGSHVLPAFPNFTMYDKTSAVGSATVRLGYLFAPQVLGYVKGGVARARNSDSLFKSVPTSFLSESSGWWNRTGWTVGGGVEWMFAPGWSVFGEYNYMDFGTNTVTFIAAPGLLPVGEHVNVVETTQMALVGVNYKFNWAQPVVAKY